MRVCTAREMMEVDRHAIATLGVPGVVLMENAGRACCRHFATRFAEAFPGPVLIVAGKGNNGGDGYVMARVLGDLGWQVKTVVLAAEAEIGGDAAVMLQVVRRLEQPVAFVRDENELQRIINADPPQIIVDAIFGTGLKSAVRGLQAAAIKLINQSAARVFAVDIPSGVDGSSGRVCGSAVAAELTVTFDEAKIGHASQPGAAYAGQLEVVDIGIPQDGRLPREDPVQLLDAAAARTLLPQRSSLGHKGSFGHLLVVAGSPGKTGAASLSGAAATRSGCGLVTVAAPKMLHDIFEVKLTEAMTCPVPDEAGFFSSAAVPEIETLLTGRDALALGPGLGVSEDLKLFVRQLVSGCERPLVIDADALNLLSGQLDCLPRKTAGEIVLTPHPGEMSRLSGISVADIQADRFEVTRAFARELGVVVLLKGVRTIIAAPDGRVNINSSGNDALASGGSGDVLTGLIGGLLAQGLDAFSAASLGAWLHGRAAELVAAECGSAGAIASDLLPQLPVVRQELLKGVGSC